jgi:hypothetical protein
VVESRGDFEEEIDWSSTYLCVSVLDLSTEEYSGIL